MLPLKSSIINFLFLALLFDASSGQVGPKTILRRGIVIPVSSSSSSLASSRRSTEPRGAQTMHTVGSTIHFADEEDPTDRDRGRSDPSDEDSGEEDQYYPSSSTTKSIKEAMESMQRGYPRRYRPSQQIDIGDSYGGAIEWAESSPEESSVSAGSFGRGVTDESDSFRLRSVSNSRPKMAWGSKLITKSSPGGGNNRVKFGPSSITIDTPIVRGGRTKRNVPQMPQERRGYPMMPMPMYNSFSTYPAYGGGGGYGGSGGYGGYQQEDEEDCVYHTLVNGDSEVSFKKILPVKMRGRTLVRTCIPRPPKAGDPRYRVLLRGNNQHSFGHLNASIKLRR